MIVNLDHNNVALNFSSHFICAFPRLVNYKGGVKKIKKQINACALPLGGKVLLVQAKGAPVRSMILPVTKLPCITLSSNAHVVSTTDLLCFLNQQKMEIHSYIG